MVININKVKYLFLVLVLFCSVGAASATDYYVDVAAVHGYSCSDTLNSGTSWSSPFCSIQKAANVVTAGSIVIVANGTYIDMDISGDIVSIPFGGSVSAPTIFKSEYKWGAILDGQNITDEGFLGWNSIDYVTIDGFQIKYIREDGILLDSDTSHITIINNSIHNIGNFIYSGTCVEAPGNYISNGILPGGGHHRIDSNLIYEIGKSQVTTCYHNWDHAIYGTYTGDSQIITNNIIYDVWTGSALDSAADNQIISNNIIARFTNIPRNDNPETMLMSLTGGSMENLTIQNNIFYNCTDNPYVIWTIWDHSGSTIRNNIKYEGCTDWVISGYGLDINYTNNLNMNPLFIDILTRNLHLQSSSPAINNGTSSGAPLYDFDGNLRGSPPDIGAYEYTGTPTPTPIIPLPITTSPTITTPQIISSIWSWLISIFGV